MAQLKLLQVIRVWSSAREGLNFSSSGRDGLRNSLCCDRARVCRHSFECNSSLNSHFKVSISGISAVTMANEKETSRWVDDQLMNMLGYNTPTTVAFVIKIAMKTMTFGDLISDLQVLEFPASQVTETFARELLMRLPQKNAGITAYPKAEKEAAAVVRKQQYQVFEEEEVLRGAAEKKQKKDENEERKHKKEVVIKKEPDSDEDEEVGKFKLTKKQEAKRRREAQERKELLPSLRYIDKMRPAVREEALVKTEEVAGDQLGSTDRHVASNVAPMEVVAHLVKTEEVAGDQLGTRRKKKRKLGPEMRFTQLKVELDELDKARVPPQELQIGDGQTALIDRCAVRPSVAPASAEGGHNPRAIMASNALQLGHTYTRDEIHKMLGGGVQTFLPTKKGRVLCGCFKLKLNPFAPTQILVGPGPMRESSAQKAVTQGGSFPIFMKQARLAW